MLLSFSERKLQTDLSFPTTRKTSMVLQSTPAYVIVHGDSKLLSISKLYPSWLLFLVLKGTSPATRRKVIINVTHLQTLRPTPVTHQQDLMCSSGTRGMEVTNNFLIELDTEAG